DLGELRGGAALAGGERKLRQHVGGGDTDLCGGWVEQGRVLAHVGTLLDEFRRHAHGQLQRQGQGVELDRRACIVGGQRAHIGGEQIALLLQLSAQRGQACESRL